MTTLEMLAVLKRPSNRCWRHSSWRSTSVFSELEILWRCAIQINLCFIIIIIIIIMYKIGQINFIAPPQFDAPYAKAKDTRMFHSIRRTYYVHFQKYSTRMVRVYIFNALIFHRRSPSTLDDTTVYLYLRLMFIRAVCATPPSLCLHFAKSSICHIFGQGTPENGGLWPRNSN